MKTFIGEWMDYMKLTPEQVGEAADISPKIIARWLKEETTPSVAQLDAVSKAIGVTMDDLTRLDPANSVVKSVDLNEEQENQKSSGPVVTTMLKEWAEKFEVTAEEIAEHTKLPVESIQKWIDKTGSPSLMEASIVAASFGISVDDLLTKNPNSFYKDYLDNHYFQTKSIKVAVRVQNWLKKHRIKNEIVVFKTKENEIFMVRYTNNSALEPIDIVRISFCRRYRDSREKNLDASSRYKGMEVVDID